MRDARGYASPTALSFAVNVMAVTPRHARRIGHDSTKESVVHSVVRDGEGVVRERRLKKRERVHGKRRGPRRAGRRRGDEATTKAVADEMNSERQRARRGSLVANPLQHVVHAALPDVARPVLHLVVRDEIGEAPSAVDRLADPVAEARSAARVRSAECDPGAGTAQSPQQLVAAQREEVVGRRPAPRRSRRAA